MIVFAFVPFTEFSDAAFADGLISLIHFAYNVTAPLEPFLITVTLVLYFLSAYHPAKWYPERDGFFNLISSSEVYVPGLDLLFFPLLSLYVILYSGAFSQTACRAITGFVLSSSAEGNSTTSISAACSSVSASCISSCAGFSNPSADVSGSDCLKLISEPASLSDPSPDSWTDTSISADTSSSLIGSPGLKAFPVLSSFVFHSLKIYPFLFKASGAFAVSAPAYGITYVFSSFPSLKSCITYPSADCPA